MRLILPKRFSLGNAIFSRGSTAYLDNRYADVGIPRIRRIGLSKMIMVEEGTTNLIPVDKQKFVGWSARFGAAVTLVQNQVVPEWGATDATRIQTNGGTQNIKYTFDALDPAVNGQPYTWSVWVKNIGSTNLRLQIYPDTVSIVTVAPGESKKCTVSIVGDGLTVLQLRFNAANASDSLDFIAWRPTAEEKAYSTSRHPSTRSAESLTIPTAGLTPGGGTIEGIFECNEMAKRTTENQWNNIFDIPTVSNTSGIMVWHNSTSWRLETRDDSGTSSASAFISDSLTPDGPIGYRVSWSPAKARLEFWSVENDVFKTLLASAEITNPKLPSAFASNMYIGSQNGSVNFLNTSFGRHRLSNIVRTDVPDLIVDANTIAVLSPTYDFLR